MEVEGIYVWRCEGVYVWMYEELGTMWGVRVTRSVMSGGLISKLRPFQVLYDVLCM